MGLTISRKLVDLLGGELTVHSPASTQLQNSDSRFRIAAPEQQSKIQNPKPVLSEAEVSKILVGGPGASFRFTLPLTDNDVSSLMPAREANNLIDDLDLRVAALEPGQPRYRILIVDDNKHNRRLLLDLLTTVTSAQAGFELREAENGRQAIEIWQEFQPHLIWMDMRMPVMDGYEATRTIKELANQLDYAGSDPEIVNRKSQIVNPKIIALTASSFDQEKANIMAAGCDDFLHKPFLEANIFRLMTKHIGVQYVYEVSEVWPNLDKNKTVALTPDSLAILPVDLLARFADAIVLADMQVIAELLQEIRAQQAELADALQQLANDFEYDHILELIEQSRG